MAMEIRSSNLPLQISCSELHHLMAVSSCCTLRCVAVFVPKPHTQHCSQPVTGHSGETRASHFCSTWISYNGRSLLWVSSTSWVRISQSCTTVGVPFYSFFPPSPFPLSFPSLSLLTPVRPASWSKTPYLHLISLPPLGISPNKSHTHLILS